MLPQIHRKDRFVLVPLLAAFLLSLGVSACWHERREPVVYVEPRHDEHERHEHHEEVRHEERHE